MDNFIKRSNQLRVSDAQDVQWAVQVRSWNLKTFVTLVLLASSFNCQGVLAQELVETNASDQLIQAAIKARQQSSLTIEKFRLPQANQQANPYRDATEQQIRNQIDLMKQLDSTMDRTKNERGERISKIRSDIQLLMLDLQKINDAKAQSTPTFNEASVQKPLDSTSRNQNSPSVTQAEAKRVMKSGVPEDGSQTPMSNNNSATSIASDPSTSGPGKESPFETMTHDPVDKLGLANNLVAIGSYQTAIQLLLDLSKDPSLDETTKNWVHFQMGRCYIGTNSIPEAREAFNKAAESLQSDIAQRTSKWWLDQLDAQLTIDRSLDKMQETLTKLEAKYGSEK